ncbi:MAG: radical SAM protein [Oscillospiraceae bacterium]|nr:radical SAM protein [Oscillospiraceae bacterium]
MIPKRKIIPIFVPHSGCPDNCVFCNQRKISGSLVPASAETVRRTIEKAAAYVGGEAEVAFYGGSFTAIGAALQEQLLSAAGEYDFIKAVRVSTRPDKIDPAALSLLRRYGVTTVELGAQSMDPEVLRLSGRGHGPDDTRRAAAEVKRYGFELILQMMTGLPGADAESDMRSALALAELRPDGVRIYPTVVIRDTPLYELWLSGAYKEHRTEDAVELCSRIVPLFEERGIPVIRLGLNPTDELSGGEAAAGAYHPALGELVYSRIFLRRAEEQLEKLAPLSSAVIFVSASDVSKMTGQGKQNLRKLRERFLLKDVRVESRRMSPGSIVISAVLS